MVQTRPLKLRYTINAAAELEAVLASINDKSPKGAQRIKQRLQDVVELLLQYPAAGRLTNKRQLRRITAFPYPFVIFYRDEGADIIIHAVRHSSRRPLSPTNL